MLFPAHDKGQKRLFAHPHESLGEYWFSNLCHGRGAGVENTILNRYEIGHHRYSAWGLLFLILFYRRRSLSPDYILWYPSYSKAVTPFPPFLGGLISRSEVLGPSSWHEFSLGGADKRIHSLMTLLLTALADQIPRGTNLPVVIFLPNVDYLSLILYVINHRVNAALEPLMTM